MLKQQECCRSQRGQLDAGPVMGRGGNGNLGGGIHLCRAFLELIMCALSKCP